VELLRNAMAAVPLVEGNEQILELTVLSSLIPPLFEAEALDAETRYREAAKQERTGRSDCFGVGLRSLSFFRV